MSETAAAAESLPTPPLYDCPFCAIVAGRAPAQVFHEWHDALAIVPLNPVVEGHLLVIPKVHVADVGHDPDISAATMKRAAQLAASLWCNVITSRGRVATQSVFHLHLHLVPRAEGDLLSLPWDVRGAGPVRPGEDSEDDGPEDGGHDFQWGDDHVQRCTRCTLPHSRWAGGPCPGPDHPLPPGVYV